MTMEASVAASVSQVFILLKHNDQAAEMSNALSGSLPRKSHTSTVDILRGELVAPLPPGDIVSQGGGKPSHNYRTLTREIPATFHADEGDGDLAPLKPDEFDVLAGIREPIARYRVFTNDLLDWGTNLKARDEVLVELEGAAATSSEPGPRVHAEIRYVGLVKTLPGITFGVEIKDKDYFGRGTLYGKFKDETYFHCKKDNGLFVSLERLFPYHQLSSAAPQPSSQDAPQGMGQQDPDINCAMPTLESEGQQDPDINCAMPTLESGGQEVIAVTNVSSAPVKLEVGSHIKLVQDPNHRGVVRWMGALPEIHGTIAGVELDAPMEGCSDGEWRDHHPTIFQNAPSHFSTGEPTSSNPTIFQNVPSHFSTAEPTSSNPTIFQNVPLPTSLAAGWEGDRANNPTTYQNVPNHLSTTKPTPIPFQNVPNHIYTTSNTTAFQNVHPLTTHAAGWDGAWADPKNPTIFQNYPCQLPDEQTTTMPALAHRNVASEPGASEDEDTGENNCNSNEQSCHVSRCSSQDSLVGNLPPPCIIFTSFETDTPTRTPNRLLQLTNSAGELNSLLSNPGPHHAFDDSITTEYDHLKSTHRLSFENRKTRISSEDGSSVDLYGSGSNLATTPTNSLQSLQLCPDHHISRSRHTSLSSENSSSVDLYGSCPNLTTNQMYCPQKLLPSLDRGNSPGLSSENSSSVDLYGSGPNLAMTPPTTRPHSLPTLDKNSPPMTASRQTSLSSGSSSSIDLYGSGKNIPTFPRNGHHPLHQDEEEDIHSSDPGLSTTEEICPLNHFQKSKLQFPNQTLVNFHQNSHTLIDNCTKLYHDC